jgi:hypothetical protein
MFSNIITRKKDVLQLALQFNLWVAKDICNSLHLYVMSSNKQVAWIAKLQLTIYTVQLIATQSKQLIFNYYATPL